MKSLHDDTAWSGCKTKLVLRFLKNKQKVKQMCICLLNYSLNNAYFFQKGHFEGILFNIRI